MPLVMFVGQADFTYRNVALTADLCCISNLMDDGSERSRESTVC